MKSRPPVRPGRGRAGVPADGHDIGFSARRGRATARGGCPVRRAPSDQATRAKTGRSSTAVMFDHPRSSSVYLVYDEDAFLAARDADAPPTAVVAASGRRGLPLRWAPPLLVAAIGASGVQFVASRTADEHRARPQPLARQRQAPPRQSRDPGTAPQRQRPRRGRRAALHGTPRQARAARRRRAPGARGTATPSHQARTLVAGTPAVDAVPSPASRPTRPQRPTSAGPATSPPPTGEFGFEG
jgi:hypothetical protein